MDLLRIANSRYHLFERVGQGIWIFDPNTETWYCLGGKTELTPNAVRHNIIEQNIWALSDDPVVYMVHPKEFESWITPNLDQPALLKKYRSSIGAFLAATPGRAEYQTLSRMLDTTDSQGLRFIIVSSLGFSHLTFPRDKNVLAQMAQYARDLRDDALLGFDWTQFDSNYGNFRKKELITNFFNYVRSGFDPRLKQNQIVTIRLVSQLIDSFNSQLPEGFQIDFYLP